MIDISKLLDEIKASPYREIVISTPHTGVVTFGDLKVGDTVWFYKPSQAERGVTSKLAFKWSGPYTVAKEIGPVTFILKDKDGKELPGTAHARHMYRQEDPPGEKGGRCHAPSSL